MSRLNDYMLNRLCTANTAVSVIQSASDRLIVRDKHVRKEKKETWPLPPMHIHEVVHAVPP